MGVLGGLRRALTSRMDFDLHSISEGTVADGGVDYYTDFTGLMNSRFRGILVFDEEGVPLGNYGGDLGPKRNPTFVSLWGLACLTKYLRTGEKEWLERFWTQVRWTMENYVDRGSQGCVWLTPFDWYEGSTLVKGPYVGCMVQGTAISLLVRAYLLSQKEEYLDLARRAADLFDVEVAEGGIRTTEDGRVFYEEYPAYPLARVLDGFVISLLGLFDLYVVGQDGQAKRRFDQGTEGLLAKLDSWEFFGCWTRYGRHPILCDPYYHRWNTCLMMTMFKLTGVEAFRQKAERWTVANIPLPKQVLVAAYAVVSARMFNLYLRLSHH